MTQKTALQLCCTTGTLHCHGSHSCHTTPLTLFIYGGVDFQACADKLEREIQLYCDPDKPGSPPVFPDDEPDATVWLPVIIMPLRTAFAVLVTCGIML